MAAERWTFGAAGGRAGATLAGLLLAAGLASCQIGSPRSEHPLALGPSGVHGTVHLINGSRLRGELLAVRENAILIIERQEVVLIPYTGINRARFRGLRSEIRRRTPPQRVQNQLRLLSRYPQGVDAELLQRLLSAYQQPALRVLP